MRLELIKKIKGICRWLYGDLKNISHDEFQRFLRAGATLKRINPKLLSLPYLPLHTRKEEVKKIVDLFYEEISWNTFRKYQPDAFSYLADVIQDGFEPHELRVAPKQVLADFLSMKENLGYVKNVIKELGTEEISELTEMDEEDFDQLKRIFMFYYNVPSKLSETPVEKVMQLKALIHSSYCTTLKTDSKMPKLAKCITMGFEPSESLYEEYHGVFLIYSDPLVEQAIDAYHQHPEARKKIIKAIEKKDRDMLKAVILSAQLLEEKDETRTR